jgi:hypothetical protein
VPRPIRAGHRMISPRSVDLTTVSVKELMEAYLAKNRSSTAPNRKYPHPRTLPHPGSRDFQTTGESNRARNRRSPGNRARPHRTTPSICLRTLFRQIAVQRQQFPQRDRPLASIGIGDRQIIQTQMADQPPGSIAVRMGRARLGRPGQAAHRADRRPGFRVKSVSPRPTGMCSGKSRLVQIA